MNKIQVLDCTLRDGGYCNEWLFGHENAKKITEGLIEANVEIIECGFISSKVDCNPETTRFTSVDDIASIIPKQRGEKLFVAMMNYGEYSLDDIPKYDGKSIDGVRVAFHKENLREALEACKELKEKGYLVFVQPMVSLSYTDEEFLNLIYAVNQFEPYAFYIVDSFGMMKEKDLTRLFYVVEHNLNSGIWIGFHSHNNMQLAYSNAQKLITIHTNRNIIIDSSIMGMGRGAGNLNTELFADYLNENVSDHYYIKPLLSIIDDILTPFYERDYWGYSLPNYISALHNAHPNYAGYLDSKKTLTYKEMDEIFSMMDDNKKITYDQSYIEEIYLKYQEKDVIYAEHFSDLKDRFNGKDVLIIAPGSSSILEKEKLVAFSKKQNVITISINHEYNQNITDYVFVSNLRRFHELPENVRWKTIVTSNIPSIDVYLQVLYKGLLNEIESVKDNAGLMLIQLLIQLDVKKIYVAGMDGYSPNPTENYANQRMNLYTKKELTERINAGMVKALRLFSKEISIEFVTKPKYITI